MLGSQESNTEWDKATQGKMYKVYYRLFKVKKKMLFTVYVTHKFQGNQLFRTITTISDSLILTLAWGRM